MPVGGEAFVSASITITNSLVDNPSTGFVRVPPEEVNRLITRDYSHLRVGEAAQGYSGAGTPVKKDHATIAALADSLL